MKNRLIQILLVACALSLTSCASRAPLPGHTPFDALDAMKTDRVRDDQAALMDQVYHSRSWVPHQQLRTDPIEFSQVVSARPNQAYTKILGPSYEDSLRSLAAKLWMIENAEHTLDLTYYIYKYDPTGYAVIGALCDAVQRGIDVRIMVDSLGSIHPTHQPMRALLSCADDAGYIRYPNGASSGLRARVQFVVINALTSAHSWSNRRSHDKLIIKDGHFPGKDMVMTGGRNISVDYYGINKDGSRNRDTYLDLEILLRSREGSREEAREPTVGDVSSVYYTLLFLHKGNLRVTPDRDDEDWEFSRPDDRYGADREKGREALAFIKGLPAFSTIYDEMPTFLSGGFNQSRVLLAHELGNLVSEDVVTNVEEIKGRNTNSIGALLATIVDEAQKSGDLESRFRVISPYLFIARYLDKDGNVIHDGAESTIKMLEENPGLSFELITNSVLTSDNFYTQSVIDMDAIPRLLLSEEFQRTWLKSREDSELNSDFIDSDEWKRLIDHPRIKIYQTGKLDSVLLGGPEPYGKLHAKTFFDDDFGFVGTSNFDYRSRLYNNEMGFYFQDPDLSQDLERVFEELKTISLRWGSPEWLEMRNRLVDAGGVKGYTTRTQRGLYKFLKETGLIWLF
jgi:phosphatidylserine/phosphatidylglycerophosphate/cardiolipin synthase-like enzyme